MKKLLLLLVTLFTFTFSFSQDREFQVSGSIIEKSSGLPLEFATISFTKSGTSEIVTGGVTDFDGNFKIDVPEGTYDIQFEYISYETIVLKNRVIDKNTTLSPVELNFNSESLDEVVVRAETTEVQVRLDKKIYNIGKDLTTQGGTVSDALNNVPSVEVDVEGGISLRGNENVRILINGKPSAMAGFGSTDVLQQLPADAVERVEVITSPSARYDAEGTAGILNIILRKEKTLGFNGSISANVGIPDNNGVSANLNLRTDKFNIFTTIGQYYRNPLGNAYFDNRYKTRTDADGNIIDPEFDRIVEDRKYDRLFRGFNSNIGMEYFINNQSSITGSLFMRFGDDKEYTDNLTQRFTDNTLVNRTLREEFIREKDKNYQFSLNYENRFDDEGHKLTADFQYGYDSEERPTQIEENILNNNGSNQLLAADDIFETEKQDEFLIQADYVLPMGEAQFEAGYRGNFEKEVTDYRLDTLNIQTGQYIRDESLTNTFTYHENVNAFYTQYGNKFGDFSFLLGLRMEHTQLKGDVDGNIEESDFGGISEDIEFNFDKNYFGLFPTVNLIYELSENENITLGYNRRINRPRGWYINPFPSRSSRTTVFQGNPDLDPAFSDTFDLGYLNRIGKLTLTSSIYYQYETDAFERIQEDTGLVTSDGINIIRSVPINLSTNERIGAEAAIMYNPTRWLRLNGSFNFFKFKTEGMFNGVDYGADNTSWFARFSSKVILPWKIDWQTNAFYRGPRENAQTKSDGILSINLAMSKEIIKDKATVSFNVSDLLNTRKRTQVTDTQFFNSDSEFQWRERQFTVSLIYRFNQPNDDRRSRGRSGNGGESFEGDEGGF